NAFDRALAKFLGMLGETLFGRVGGEGRQDVAAAGQDAQKRAETGAAQDWSDDAPDVVAGEEKARDLLHADFTLMLVFEIAQDFGDAEDPYGDRDEVEATEHFAHPECEAGRAGI